MVPCENYTQVVLEDVAFSILLTYRQETKTKMKHLFCRVRNNIFAVVECCDGDYSASKFDGDVIVRGRVLEIPL